MSKVYILIGCLFIVACGTKSVERELINGPEHQWLYDNWNFSEAVKVGNQIWLSGQVGYDSRTKSYPESLQKQTELVFNNIERILKRAGASMSDIVGSFVNDVLMPPLGVLLGGVDFKDLAFTVKEAVGDTPAVTLNYGNFIQTAIDFIIIAFAIFMMVKAMNSMKKKEEEAPAEDPKPSNEEVLLSEIRDLLKKD